jgi:hypothetical protein
MWDLLSGIKDNIEELQKIFPEAIILDMLDGHDGHHEHRISLETNIHKKEYFKKLKKHGFAYKSLMMCISMKDKSDSDLHNEIEKEILNEREQKDG